MKTAVLNDQLHILAAVDDAKTAPGGGVAGATLRAVLAASASAAQSTAGTRPITPPGMSAAAMVGGAAPDAVQETVYNFMRQTGMTEPWARQCLASR